MTEQVNQYRSLMMMREIGDGRCILCGDRGVIGDLCHQCGMDECRYMESHASEPWEYLEGVTQGFIHGTMGDDDAYEGMGGEADDRADVPGREAADGENNRNTVTCGERRRHETEAVAEEEGESHEECRSAMRTLTRGGMKL